MPALPPALSSSATDDWATPRWLVELLARELGPFDFDPAADDANHCAPRWCSREQDGLHPMTVWAGRVWLNPPWTKKAKIDPWIKRAVHSVSDAGFASLVCALIPARTETWIWQNFVLPCADEVRLISGRLKFGEATNSAPFPSAVVIWRRGGGGPARVRAWNPRDEAKRMEAIMARGGLSGEEIREIRRKLFLTQAALAYLLSAAPNQIGRWEREQEKPRAAAARQLDWIRRALALDPPRVEGACLWASSPDRFWFCILEVLQPA